MRVESDSVILHHSVSSVDIYRQETGHESIDALAGLARLLRTIKDAKERSRYFNRAVPLMSANRLRLEQSTLTLSSSDIFARRQGMAEAIRLNEGMLLTATVDTFSYMYDEELQLNDLAINFVDPTVLARIDSSAPIPKGTPIQTRVEGLMFKVPVLAIGTCMDGELL